MKHQIALCEFNATYPEPHVIKTLHDAFRDHAFPDPSHTNSVNPLIIKKKQKQNSIKIQASVESRVKHDSQQPDSRKAFLTKLCILILFSTVSQNT